jgi:hypothetical protein
MRLACLLFAGLVLLFTSCRPSRSNHFLYEHPGDTLSKYSYLLVVWKKNKWGKTVGFEKATGFFYRQDDRLYLVSAYHALRGFPSTSKEWPDSLDIWFQVDSNNYTYRRVPLDSQVVAPHKSRAEIVDVSAVDVSVAFEGVHINSVERLVCSQCDLDSLSKKDTLVCYGFSNVFDSQPNYGSTTHAVIDPIGRVREGYGVPLDDVVNYTLKNQYYFIHRKLCKGDSGTPLFRIISDGSSNNRAELIGVQSATRRHKNYSTITMQACMMQQLFYSK